MGNLLNKGSWTFNVSFVLILESLNEIWTNFERFVLRCYNKLWPVWRQNTLRKRVKFAHKNNIYSQYFSLNSLCKACSVSLCNPYKLLYFSHSSPYKLVLYYAWVTCGETSAKQTKAQTQARQPNKQMVEIKCRLTLAVQVAKSSLSSNGNNAKDNVD